MFIDMFAFMLLARSYKPLSTELAEEEPIIVDEPLLKPAGIDNIAFTKELPNGNKTD